MLKPTPFQDAIILGSLLGDSTLQKRGSKSFRFRMVHSVHQKEYIFWKHEQLKNLALNNSSPKLLSNSKNYQKYEFYLDSGLWLKPYYDLFFREINASYKRCITEELINSLPVDPLILAIWFLDDGSVRDDCYAGKIATQGFQYIDAKKENELLAMYLSKFGIKAEVITHTVKSKQFYLSLPAKGNVFSDFVKLIEPTVSLIPSMLYKIKR